MCVAASRGDNLRAVPGPKERVCRWYGRRTASHQISKLVRGVRKAVSLASTFIHERRLNVDQNPLYFVHKPGESLAINVPIFRAYIAYLLRSHTIAHSVLRTKQTFPLTRRGAATPSKIPPGCWFDSAGVTGVTHNYVANGAFCVNLSTNTVRKTSEYSVAFQGERGSFSFAVACKLLGPHCRMLPCQSFTDVFVALASGRVTHAVIPIENTLHGSVHENYDHLLEYNLPICGETSIRISHQLIALPGTRFRQVRRAFSHPVALNQCRAFFEKHKEIEPVPFYDTAGSVKMLKEQRPPEAAAIASETAADMYGGILLKRNIEDNRRNFTRFFVLSKRKAALKSATGEWKTSIAFSTPNTPGALFRAMACFALRDLNLTKIESRPLRARPWEYLFYLDITGSEQDPPLKRALANLSEIANSLKVLGSYRPTP